VDAGWSECLNLIIGNAPVIRSVRFTDMKMEPPSLKRFLHAAGAFVALAFVIYVEVPAIYGYLETGSIVFRYHSNLFYGNEASVMHFCSVAVCLVLAYLSLENPKKPNECRD